MNPFKVRKIPSAQEELEMEIIKKYKENKSEQLIGFLFAVCIFFYIVPFLYPDVTTYFIAFCIISGIVLFGYFTTRQK